MMELWDNFKLTLKSLTLCNLRTIFIRTVLISGNYAIFLQDFFLILTHISHIFLWRNQTTLNIKNVEKLPTPKMHQTNWAIGPEEKKVEKQ